MIVSIYGQDTKIGTAEASWLAQLPLYEEFRIGQKVDVKLLEIDNNFIWETNGRRFHLSKLTGSIRQAQNNPNITYFDDFKENGRYIADVKSMTSDGMKVFVTIQNKITVMCNAPMAGGCLGSKALVYITKKDEKEHLFWGTIVNPSI